MLAVLLQTETTTLDRFLSLIGVFVCIGIAFLMSVDRSKIDWKVVGWGVALQFIFALIVLHPAMQKFFFVGVSSAVETLRASQRIKGGRKTGFGFRYCK